MKVVPPGTHALAPSSLTFDWEACRRCFWLQANGLRKPYLPFPAVFNAMDAQMKLGFRGRRLDELIVGMPGCVMKYADEWVESETFGLRGRASRYFIRGKFDTVVEFDDGSFGVVDFKVSHRKAEYIPLYARQLHAYALALEHPGPGGFGVSPISRMGLIVFEPTVFLATGFNAAVSAGYLEWVEIPRDDGTFTQFIKGVMGMLDEPAPPSAAEGCVWCRFRDACRGIEA